MEYRTFRELNDDTSKSDFYQDDAKNINQTHSGALGLEASTGLGMQRQIQITVCRVQGFGIACCLGNFFWNHSG